MDFGQLGSENRLDLLLGSLPHEGRDDCGEHDLFGQLFTLLLSLYPDIFLIVGSK